MACKCLTFFAVLLEALNFPATGGRFTTHFFHAVIACFVTKNKCHNMEPTVCMFSTGKGECSGKRNNNLTNLICEKHLNQYFGLEIFHSFVETLIALHFTGWCLKPVPGMFFKKGDVILALQDFFDKIYRPNQVSRTEADLKYKINSRTDEFMKRALHDGRFSKSDRLMYELIRNLSEPRENINNNPTKDCENDPKAIAYIRSKMAISETFIEKLSIQNRINKITLHTDDIETPITKLGLSASYKYMMSRFEYSSHLVTDLDDQTIELPRLMYNAVFVKDVGLVAVSDISDPDVIVVHGATRGQVKTNDYGYYDELVIAHPKEVINSNPRLAAQRLSTNNAINKAFTTSCI
ncbi:uncharacterized protein TNCT_226631 [Trichonephila clavata]|uniref:Uncharacterized protein n=1 Tax=Trichonephila clavata TaxID=2740835 RepID=A0A8X6HBD7_TRICU|nr:uncharacterized protein TNCT_226631 [Trichonephila clavata]